MLAFNFASASLLVSFSKASFIRSFSIIRSLKTQREMEDYRQWDGGNRRTMHADLTREKEVYHQRPTDDLGQASQVIVCSEGSSMDQSTCHAANTPLLPQAVVGMNQLFSCSKYAPPPQHQCPFTVTLTSLFLVVIVTHRQHHFSPVLVCLFIVVIVLIIR